jgi:Tol biopolymer transport system component
MHMHYLRFRSYRALILGALGGCVVLAACQPASTAPAAVAPSPAAVLAPSTLGIPTARPATVATSGTLTSPATAAVTRVPSPPPNSLPDATPTASEPLQSRPLSPSIARLSPFEIDRLTAVAVATSSAVPAAPTPTPPPQAATLPADQPWFLIADEHPRCGTDIPASHLVTVNRAGQLTQLDHDVTAVTERPGAPPLLATCAADGTSALLDPVHWTSLRLPLKPAVVVTQIILSPDHKHAILQITCWRDSRCDDGRPVEGHLFVDLRSGAMRPAEGLPTSSGGGGPYNDSIGVRLEGWGAAGLYYSTSGKGWSALNVIDPTHPQAPSRELARNTPYALDSAADLLVFFGPPSVYPSMTVFDVRHDTTQIIDQAAVLSLPAIAPDGTALAYIRSDQGSDSAVAPHAELVIFDIARHTKTVLTELLGHPIEMFAYGSGGQAIYWLPDSRRVVAITRAPTRPQAPPIILSSGEEISVVTPPEPQASLLARDGTLLTTVPLPDGRPNRVTNDEQLMLDVQGTGVRWLPMRAGVAPYAPDQTLREGSITPVYVPPSGGSTAAPQYATLATPPPVTQLPAPVAPTPLPAVLAPITRLGTVANDTTFFENLPVYDHLIYRVRGTFYSQALRGGPPVSLGGDDQYWTNAVFLSPDGKALIYQLSDAVYRASLDDGARQQLTPPLASGESIAEAQASPDGRYVVYGVAGPKPAAWKDQLKNYNWIIALYRLPIAGGPPVRLTPPLDPDSDLFGILITPDSQWVIYSVEVPDPNFPLSDGQISTRTVALYSVPLTGGPPLRLAESSNESDPIAGRRLSEDGQYVLYQPRSAGALFRVSVRGGPAVQLSGSGGEQVSNYQTSPDHRLMLYENVSGIYVAPLAGGTPVNLTSSVKLIDGVYGEQFTPDGTQVVFRTGSALYRVSIGGGTAIKLSELTGIYTNQFGFAVANERVVYQDADVIYSVALAGGTPVRLTPALPPGASLQMDQLSPDTRLVIYTIEQATDRTRTIATAPIDGGAPVVLLAGRMDDTALDLVSGGYAIGVAGGMLYAAPLVGGPRLQLSSATNKVLDSPVISPDGRHIIYLASRVGQSSTDVTGLYVAKLPASQP